MSNFRKPDLNAPRYRPECHQIATPKFFEKFKDKYPQYKGLKNTDLKKTIDKCNQKLWETCLDNRDGIELPESLGNILIASCNASKSKRNIDFGKSLKYGTKVMNQNLGADGLLCKIFYTNKQSKYKVIDRQLWQFIACRTFKRTASKVYSENWPMYIKLENSVKISKMYKDIRAKNFAIKSINNALEDYNEFDI